MLCNIENTEPAEVMQPDALQEEKPTAKKKPFFLKKPFILSAVALLLVGAIVAVLFIFVWGKRPSHIMYIKDGELYYTGESKLDPVQICDDLYDSRMAHPNSVAMATRISQDGKYVFFPSDIDSLNAFKLCYRQTNGDGESVKLAGDVVRYQLVNKGKKVVYLTDDQDLCLHDLKKETQLAYNVHDFCVSEDGKNLLFRTGDDSLYLRVNDKEELLSEDVGYFYVNDNFTAVYYIVDRELFKKTVGKDTVKVDNNVDEVIATYNSGEAYYLKTYTTTFKMSKFIKDDSGLKQPSALLSEVRDTDYDHRTTGLFFFDGKKPIKITDNVKTKYKPVIAANNPVVAVCAASYDDTHKVSISNVYTVKQAKEKLAEALKATEPSYVIAMKGEKYDTGMFENSLFAIDDDGKNIYYLSYTNGNNQSKLYHATVKNYKIDKDKYIDSGVYGGFLMITADGKPVYFKNYDEDYRSGTLMIDKAVVAERATSEKAFVNKANGTFVFFTKYVPESRTGTLNVTDNKTFAEVSDKVINVTATPSGNLLYMSYYKNGKGELYMFDDKKSTYVDDDVYGVLDVYDWNEPAYLY